MIGTVIRMGGMVLWMAWRVLYVYFVEIRWVVVIVKESVLHPLSESYVDVKTGKLVARYPTSGPDDAERQEIPENGQGGINRRIAVCLVLILTGVAIKVWLNYD